MHADSRCWHEWNSREQLPAAQHTPLQLTALLPGRRTSSTTTESATTSAQAVDALPSSSRSTTAVGVEATVAMPPQDAAPAWWHGGMGRVEAAVQRTLPLLGPAPELLRHCTCTAMGCCLPAHAKPRPPTQRTQQAADD